MKPCHLYTVTDRELRKVLNKLFDRLDHNNNDFLNLQEVEEMMRQAHMKINVKVREGKVREDALEFMREADKKNDGLIDR